MQRRIQRLAIVAQYIAPKSCLSPIVVQHFFPYLSRALSTREKMICALTHFEFEEHNRNRFYKHSVYGGSGLILWERVVNGRVYEIHLKSADVSYEGELDVVLRCDETLLSIMSFSYVEKRVFGLDTGISLIVTRNQTHKRSSASNFFYGDFKQNFPQYFCVSAIYGIAQAHNFEEFLGIPARDHVFYNGHHGFQNSYDEVWKRFNGIDCGRVYSVKSPMDICPISLVNPSHRRRAVSRRENWQQIIDSTKAMLEKTLA
jgi:uncharacterized protein VirK/YbjX